MIDTKSIDLFSSGQTITRITKITYENTSSDA